MMQHPITLIEPVVVKRGEVRFAKTGETHIVKLPHCGKNAMSCIGCPEFHPRKHEQGPKEYAILGDVA